MYFIACVQESQVVKHEEMVKTDVETFNSVSVLLYLPCELLPSGMAPSPSIQTLTMATSDHIIPT